LVITSVCCAADPAASTMVLPADGPAIDAAIDQFLTTSDGERAAAVAAVHAAGSGRSRADLDELRKHEDQPSGLLKHVQIPWLHGHPRGWYNLTLPDGYSPDRAAPLVVALHGMPADGDNVVPFYHPHFACRGTVVLYPTTLGAESVWWTPTEQQQLLRLIGYIYRTYRIDADRISLSGASGGGIGTWHGLVRWPDLFCAGISFSGMGTIFDDSLAKLKTTPFYVHHGTADPIPIESVDRAVAAARKKGVSIEYFRSEGTGHTPPMGEWIRAFEWLRQQGPKQPSPRAQFEGRPGSLPLGYPQRMPFAPYTAPRNPTLSAREAIAAWKLPSQPESGDLLKALLQISAALRCGSTAQRRQ
jgi:poly(3-hydroxybutyrate) depolymerase